MAALLALGVLLPIAASADGQTQATAADQAEARDAVGAFAGPSIFRFSTDGFWLGLHHFLYVLGRAEAGERDAQRRAVAGAPTDAGRGLATLTAEERQVWSAAVTVYARGLSRLDAVFDEELIAVARTLAATAGRSLDGVALEQAAKGALEQAAPLYRMAWWAAHRAANEAWVAAMEPLLTEHGAAVVSLVSGWYGQNWPAAGYPVHLVPYSNWAGAYSTTGELLVVASLDRELQGSLGLEIVVHEAMHQWDETVGEALAAAAREQGIQVPEGLTHAMIFFTAGEAVRRLVPGHVPYAERHGIWRRGSGRWLPALEAAWRPYLDGQGTREAAMAALLRAATAEPPAGEARRGPSLFAVSPRGQAPR